MNYDIDSLTAMWVEDANIEQLELDKESLKIPKLQAKWAGLLKKFTFQSKNLENKYKKLRQKKWRYYSGKMEKEELKENGWEPFQYVLKSDLEVFLEGDGDLIDMGTKKFVYEEMADFCKLVIKELQNRQWNIKNSIEFMKYTEGG